METTLTHSTATDTTFFTKKNTKSNTAEQLTLALASIL